jgi:hypothetical protein
MVKERWSTDPNGEVWARGTIFEHTFPVNFLIVIFFESEREFVFT